MMGFSMGYGGIWMILFWVLVIAGSIWLLTQLFPKSTNDSNVERREDPLQIVDERYARGELTKEEYTTLRSDLEGYRG
jgi:putative membrane protein